VAQWKALRTTNAIERINEEFRRRVKTQGSLPSQDAVNAVAVRVVAQGSDQVARTRRVPRNEQRGGAVAA
jgi:transposase-like protein